MAKRAKAGGPHGVLIVDKPRGPTSHDIVAQARRHFNTRRVGHAGTLDPMATGVLVLLFGEATKLCDLASANDKCYSAELCFGRSTDSHDADGNTIEEASAGWAIDEQQLRQVVALERARAEQVPPGVSALKVAGQRAYRLSRAGTPPKLEPRPVRVHAIELEHWDQQHARLELLVTKGYYVRALARDMSRALGIPAHLGALRRLRSGSFSLAEACSWPPSQSAHPLPLAAALARLVPILRLKTSSLSRARSGQTLTADDFLDPPPEGPPGAPGGVWGWTDDAGSPVALGERKENGFRVRRGFMAGPGAPGLAEIADIPAT